MSSSTVYDMNGIRDHVQLLSKRVDQSAKNLRMSVVLIFILVLYNHTSSAYGISVLIIIVATSISMSMDTEKKLGKKTVDQLLRESYKIRLTTVISGGIALFVIFYNHLNSLLYMGSIIVLTTIMGVSQFLAYKKDGKIVNDLMV